jgi:hypothetical protein
MYYTETFHSRVLIDIAVVSVVWHTRGPATKCFLKPSLGLLLEHFPSYKTGVYFEQWPHMRHLATIWPVQRLATIQPRSPYLPVWHFNLRPMRQYLLLSNSSKFEINPAKLNFGHLTTEQIRDLVSNERSLVTSGSKGHAIREFFLKMILCTRNYHISVFWHT